MKSLAALAATVVIGLTLGVGDAEAKRLGSGKSTGMQREAVSPQKAPPAAAPAQTAPAQQAAAPAAAGGAAAAAQPKRSWMGPLAGLAAGLGLAALASHFGFGEALANFMLIALAGVVVLMVVGYFMRKKAMAKQAQQPGLAYAGAGASYDRAEPTLAQAEPAAAPLRRESNGVPEIGSAIGGGGPVAAQDLVKRAIPADFDVAGFVRNAKVNFVRLQAANDAGNLDDLREFTSPEMFAEIRMDFDDRKGAAQQTEIIVLEADVIAVVEEAARYVVSVRFVGSLREEKGADPVTLDEVWHLIKPLDGSRGWVVAGIQQVQ